MYLDKKVTVEHLGPTVSGREAYQPHPGYTFIPMNIQPTSFDFQSVAEGIYVKLFKAFTTSSGIVEGFRLTVSGTTDQYVVRGRQAYDYGPLPHYELVLERGTR
jgi:hypothetical protein